MRAQPPHHRLCGAHAPPAEHHVQRARFANKSGEAIRPAGTGDDAETHLGLAGLRVGSEDADAVQGAAEIGEEGGGLGGGHRGALLEVGASAEGLVEGGGEDEDARLVGGGCGRGGFSVNVFDGGGEFLHEGAAEGVHGAWVVESEYADDACVRRLEGCCACFLKDLCLLGGRQRGNIWVRARFNLGNFFFCELSSHPWGL
ncbi:hypothetical protein FH972_024397 [Carpinus fangiana]|uniref:Uncharacterized protein n=1 Tax=Carpinus fangiana TaxID=176857 RepID=A0A5N6KXX1_9ROSI|nr:hypothetical protein FH972_024397 [Carpinus fangiana]